MLHCLLQYNSARQAIFSHFQIRSKLVNKGLGSDEAQEAALKKNLAVTPPLL